MRFVDILIQSPHQNILRFIEVFSSEDDFGHYFVSELAPIGDLDSVLNEVNAAGDMVWYPLKPLYARHLILGVANGVQHLLSLGICHGDIKLENILIFWSQQTFGYDYRLSRFIRMVPKLCDFTNSEMGEPGSKLFLYSI